MLGLCQTIPLSTTFALQNLHKNKDTVIQKSGNFILIAGKADYLDKIENLNYVHKLKKKLI